MKPTDVVSQAAAIARVAHAKAEQADLEVAIREAENSDVPVLRSLARTYRMLQRPFY